MREKDRELFQAVLNGRLDLVNAAIQTGADVNSRNDLCQTPLHWAAAHNRPSIAQFLIEHGADISAKDRWHFKPRDYVIDREAPELVNLLKAPAGQSSGHA